MESNLRIHVWMFAKISTAVGERKRIHVGCSLRFLPTLVKESVYTLDVRNCVLGEEMRIHVGCLL